MVSGAELDYLLASRSIAPFVDIKANWDVSLETSRWPGGNH